MEIRYHKSFRKGYVTRIKPNPKLVKQFKSRLKEFILNQKNPILKDHALKGTMKGLRAFSITGDIRVIYIQDTISILLIDIGSHNQVY